jgi:hypothetical protein
VRILGDTGDSRKWRLGLARAGSIWDERQVVSGGGSVFNGSGVQIRNSPWKNTASGSSQRYDGVAKA